MAVEYPLEIIEPYYADYVHDPDVGAVGFETVTHHFRNYYAGFFDDLVVRRHFDTEETRELTDGTAQDSPISHPLRGQATVVEVCPDLISTGDDCYQQHTTQYDLLPLAFDDIEQPAVRIRQAQSLTRECENGICADSGTTVIDRDAQWGHPTTERSGPGTDQTSSWDVETRISYEHLTNAVWRLGLTKTHRSTGQEESSCR